MTVTLTTLGSLYKAGNINSLLFLQRALKTKLLHDCENKTLAKLKNPIWTPFNGENCGRCKRRNAKKTESTETTKMTEKGVMSVRVF